MIVLPGGGGAQAIKKDDAMMPSPPVPVSGGNAAAPATAIMKSGVTQAVPWESDTSMVVRCVFCRGSACRSCAKDAYLSCNKPAFEGLHSNWISEKILAMQRPSSRAIKENQLLDKFKTAGIRAIFNCTVQGEHPLCGDGILEKTGFSYDPEDFQKNGIEYYNFAWEDMTVPTIAMMQNFVRIAAAVLYREGKIAVHCHAGFGRTGIVIACVLMLTEGMTADQAILRVREKRTRSIQTKFQEAFVKEFRDHMFDIGLVYRKARPIAYPDAVNNQMMFLHGEPAQHRRWIAQPLYLCISALQAIASSNPSTVAEALVGVDGNAWGPAEELLLDDFKEAANRQEWHNWEDMVRVARDSPTDIDPRIPAQLMFDYLTNLKEALLVSEVCVAEITTLIDSGLLEGGGTEELNDAAQKLACINGCHHSTLSTLEKIKDLLRSLNIHLMTSSGNNTNKALFAPVNLRMGIALMQLDKLFGPLVLNGRSLNHIPPYANYKTSTRTTLRILDSARLDNVLQQMDKVGKFMHLLVQTWQMVPKTMVGSPVRRNGKYLHYLLPLEGVDQAEQEQERERKEEGQEGEVENKENVVIEALIENVDQRKAIPEGVCEKQIRPPQDQEEGEDSLRPSSSAAAMAPP